MKENVFANFRKVIDFYFVVAMTVYNLYGQLCKDTEEVNINVKTAHSLII
jgi:hypothetical protein